MEFDPSLCDRGDVGRRRRSRPAIAKQRPLVDTYIVHYDQQNIGRWLRDGVGRSGEDGKTDPRTRRGDDQCHNPRVAKR